MIHRSFILLLALFISVTTAVRAQECVTCWTDKCAESASYIPRCPAKGPPAVVAPEPAHHGKKATNSRSLIGSGKVAVLEFDNKLSGADAKTDRTYFSDAVRAVAKRVATGAFVMTRESVLELLKSNGKTVADCFGDCEVETGRKLGADYVVSGRLTKVGTRFFLTLRLHATRNAELLNTAKAVGKTLDKLVDASDAAAERLLRGEPPNEDGDGAATSKVDPPPEKPSMPSIPAPVPQAPIPAPEPQKPACSEGQSINVDTAGHCCWSGQVWSGIKCVGAPLSCPEAMTIDAENDRCVEAPCGEGKRRVAGSKSCCWEGQLWSKSRSVCVGRPSVCPNGLRAAADGCKGAEGGETKVEPKSGATYVYIPAGSFHFGCEPQDTQCSDDEKPGRAATVAAFWLAKTDVTVNDYEKCFRAGACNKPDTGGKCTWDDGKSSHPINCVNWPQARAFCSWVGGRLPTAEEWEYAAKSGESRVYPWGNESPNGELARYGGGDGTAAVGSYPRGASKWGLLDMAGNVWQWTATDYDSSKKELRGGSWYVQPQYLRASGRFGYDPSPQRSIIGFRCGL